MKNNNVFVGPGNIAGNAMYVANSIKKAGIRTKSFSYYVHPFGYPCDHDNILFNNPFPKPEKRNFFQKFIINKYTLRYLRVLQKLLLLAHSLLLYDTFIFISHETFFINNKDLWLIRFLKKKIAFLFVGCPERDPTDIINQTDRGICSFCNDIGKQNFLNCYNGIKKKKKIEYISRFADIIFSHRDTTSFILEKKKIKTFYCLTYPNTNRDEVLKKFKDSNEFVISHLPSNSLLKGTDSVRKAIDNIRSKGMKFQFISDRVNHSEIGALLNKSHILIDQFSIGHGLLSVEGMANGCVVICRTANWFKADFPELPVISCEPEELGDILIDLLSNPEKMLTIALKSLEYYQKYHTPEVVGNYYKNILELN